MALVNASWTGSGRSGSGAASKALPDTANGTTVVNSGGTAAPTTNPATSLIQLRAFALATPGLLLNAPPLRRIASRAAAGPNRCTDRPARCARFPDRRAAPSRQAIVPDD